MIMAFYIAAAFVMAGGSLISLGETEIFANFWRAPLCVVRQFTLSLFSGCFGASFGDEFF